STVGANGVASAHGGGETQPVPQPHQPLVVTSYESRPLSHDIRVINKVSQNLHAEIMLRLLGHEKGNGGTVEGGLEVLRGFLTSAGVPKEEHVFYHGSVLSRQNLS